MPEEQMTPEQIEELKEKIKHMSPEELREFQKKQCIFCHIVAGKVQSRKIYEDDKCLGLLDINPVNPGHVLLLPKEHYSIMPQLPEDILNHMSMVAKAISSAQLKALEANGTNILIANGPAAGQKAQHFMMHIIPRKEDDGISFNVPQRKMEEKSLSQIQATITKKLGAEIKEEPKIAAPKKKVVEAEFEEEKETKTKEKPIKKEKAKEKKEARQKQDTKREEVNLDDIANVLGVR